RGCGTAAVLARESVSSNSSNTHLDALELVRVPLFDCARDCGVARRASSRCRSFAVPPPRVSRPLPLSCGGLRLSASYFWGGCDCILELCLERLPQFVSVDEGPASEPIYRKVATVDPA